ncbi:MAG: hypothetical protein RR409_02035 [Clostridium sp.]
MLYIEFTYIIWFHIGVFIITSIHKELRKSLSEKGFNVIEEFACRGFMDYSFTKYFGGLNKGRQNDEDLRMAREFARVIKNKGY